MRTTGIIIRSLVSALGVVATFAFLITKIPAALAWATSRSYEYGDLYRFAKINDFKPAEPLPRGKISDVDSIDAGRLQPDQNDAIFLGDSFGFCDWGQGPFNLQLQRKLGVELYKVYNNHHNSPWENPYRYLDSLTPPSRSTRTVVYEIVERSIQRRFEKSWEMTEVHQPVQSSASTLSEIKDNMLQNTEVRHEALITCSNLTFPIISIWDTFLFHTFGSITPETPLFSLKPPFLFYKEEVQCFETRHTDKLITRLADNIASLSNDLKSNLNDTLVFIPVPNKVTLYWDLAKEKPYDDFLPRLCAALKMRGVNTVDLLPALRQQNQLLYWPTDTHWNNAAIQIAVEKTVQNWPRQP